MSRRSSATPVALSLLAVSLLTLAVPAASATASPPGSGARHGATLVLPSFYDVPDPLPAGAPGDIIKSEVVAAPGLHGTLLRVMYHSRSIAGGDIAVTGVIAIPSAAAPAAGYPVVSWAHGTTGIADECAPSLDATGAIPGANTFLDRGWEVTATDYEGLGTPGRHPYIVGVSEARGVIDIVRGARNLPEAHAGDRYIVWGHSQGGHAAMFSLHIADAWAPELHLEGVVAGAPPSQLNLVYDYLVTSPFKYYLLMVGAAINAAYGDTAAPLSAILTPAGVTEVGEVDNGCTGYLSGVTAGQDVAALMKVQSDGTRNPFSNALWKPLIAAQDPEGFTSAAPEPLLIIHGGNDEQIPTVSSDLLASHLCGIGQGLERWVYPGQSHAGVIDVSFDDMVTWMADRFDGGAFPDPYEPVGRPDVITRSCAPSAGGPTTTTVPSSTTATAAPRTPAAEPVSAQPTFTG